MHSWTTSIRLLKDDCTWGLSTQGLFRGKYVLLMGKRVEEGKLTLSVKKDRSKIELGLTRISIGPDRIRIRIANNLDKGLR